MSMQNQPLAKPTMSTTTQSPAVTTPQKPAVLTIRQQLETPQFAEAVAKCLPRHLTPDRFLRVALTALTTTPKLAQCTQASFFSSLLKLSQYGLEPDGRRAHLIPYKNGKASAKAGFDVYDCQLIIDYKGLAELVMRSGLVSRIHADVIREGDLFSYSMGELSSHTPWFLRRDSAKPAAAGDVFAVYCVALMKDGSSKCEVMSKEDVEAVRVRSSAGQDGPWITDWCEMAKKTPFRRLTKWLPLSPEIREASEGDDDVIELAPNREERAKTPALTAPSVPFALDFVQEDEPTTEGGGK